MSASIDLTKREKMALVTNMFFVNYFSIFACCMISSFYPLQGAEQGLSTLQIGFVFGCFELVIFLISIPLGIYLPVIGARFMFISGIFIQGSACILMGCLSWCPPGLQFFVSSLLTRLFQAIGASLTLTSTMAILGHVFPRSFSTLFGIIEISTGFAFMTGPLGGGLLYEFGGFPCPFFVAGGLCLFVVLVSLLYFPYYAPPQPRANLRLHSLLRCPGIWVSLVDNLVICFCLSFLGPLMQPFLHDKFHLPPSMVGAVFLTFAATYALTSFVWGFVVDRFPKYDIFKVVGLLEASIGFLLLAPSPLFYIKERRLWLTIIGGAIFGLSGGAIFVPTMKHITKEAVASGLPHNLETAGTIAGLTNSVASLGFFLGPVIGGVLTDALDFDWSTTIVAGVCLICSIMTGIFGLLKSCCSPSSPVAQTEVVTPSVQTLTSESSPLLP